MDQEKQVSLTKLSVCENQYSSSDLFLNNLLAFHTVYILPVYVYVEKFQQNGDVIRINLHYQRHGLHTTHRMQAAPQVTGKLS